MAKSAEPHPKDPAPFIALSNRETLGWSAALFILFGWLFFLGVLVGRGSIKVDLTPTQVQRELAVTLEKQAVPPFGKKRDGTKATASSVELSFYKDVKQSEEAITKSSRMTKAEKQVIPPGKVPRVQPQAHTAATTRPLKPQVTAARPAPKTPSVGTGAMFTIQVAAHIQKTAAESEAKALRAQGFTAYFLAAKNSKGQTWYRVRVGRFAQRSDAKKELSRLTRLKNKAYVVKLGQPVGVTDMTRP